MLARGKWGKIYPRFRPAVWRVKARLVVMTSSQEFVLRTLEDQDIRYIRLWFTDMWGMLKSVVVVPAEIESAFAEGIGFDGSAIEGYSRVAEACLLYTSDAADE